MDSEDHTALYTAIANLQLSAVEVICEHSENNVEALQQTGVDGTCLHKALELRSCVPAMIEAIYRVIEVLGNHQDV